MKKRIITTICTLIGAALGFSLSLVLDKYIFQGSSTLPTFIEVGIFFTLPAVLALLGGLLAFFICPLVYVSHDMVLRNCVITAVLLSVFGVFLLSAGGQKLYEISLKNGQHTIIIALDQSASMDGDRNRNTIRSAKKLVDSLNDEDKVGLIFFGNEATVKSEIIQANSKNKKLIKSTIDQLEATDGYNILQNALDEAVRMLANEESENTGIFIVSDLDGFTDLRAMGKLDKPSFLAEEIPLHTLVINASENYEMQEFCEQSGGKYLHTDDPNDIEELYMSMFYEFYQNDLQLNHVRDTDTVDWLRILISAVYFILLGAVMTAIYTIVYNNKNVVFIWNSIIAVIAAIIIEINNVYLGEPILMLAAMFVIYPAVYMGSLPKEDVKKMPQQASAKQLEGVGVYDEGHIIR